MDALVASMPTLTQRAAFERVFGCRYAKSTVCRHRGVWRRAREDIRTAFERMGRDERAVWGEFVRRVEGRASGLQVPVPGNLDDVNGLGGPGIDVGVGEETSNQGVDMVHQHMQGGVMPNGMGQVQRLVPGQVTHHMMRHEEEESAEEAVMGSLGPPPEHNHVHSGQQGSNGLAGTGSQGMMGGSSSMCRFYSALYIVP